MVNALTVDVEDYFQVTAFERQVDRREWGTYPLRVVDNTRRILDLFARHGVRATFFVLGWVAEREPALVRAIRDGGHEIASHGYGHELVYRIGPERFAADVRRSRELLQDITGQAVYGYRAPSYSITGRSLWAFDILAEEGFRYDSSTFPVRHDIYGIPGGERFPHLVKTPSGTLLEFPLTTFPFGFGKWRTNIPVAGGGYLRLLPAPLVAAAMGYVNRIEQQPGILYFHPWELDPAQPRIPAGLKSRFRHYLNLERMERKVEYLLKNLQFTTLTEATSLMPAVQPVTEARAEAGL